jgi:NarL family two-component system response regulator LiaR
MSDERIRVLLVDDHAVVRQGLRSYLQSFGDIAIAGSAASGEEALGLLETSLPDVAVVDLLMPGGMDGFETIRRVRNRSPHTQVVVLSGYSDDARVLAALRAGAIGYVRKEADPEMLLAAVRAAARGQSTLDPALAHTVLQELTRKPASADPDALTPREEEVLRQLALGRTNRQIAEALVVGEETVKTHVGNILAKLHLAHRAQAMIYALKQGLVSVEDLNLT